MKVQELNTLHTVCELKRTHLITILAMSVKKPQLAGFLVIQLEIVVISCMLKDLQHIYMIAFILYHLYTKQINALIEFTYTIEKL